MRIEASVDVPSIKPAEAVNVGGSSQELSVEKVRETANNDGAGKSNKDLSENILNEAMKQANKELKNMNRSIERHIHEKTKSVMYKIIDTNTKEVIKEFPPEKIQDMIAKMWELAGLFVDEKA